MSVAAASTRPTRAAQEALQLLRCQVFQTTYNPSAVRTGAKYLKKRLRGQAMIDYITPSPALDIARGTETYAQRIKEGTSSLTKLRKIMEDPEFRIEGRPTMRSGPWWQTEDPKNPDSKLVNFDKDMFVRAVKDYKAGAPTRGDVAFGFEEVDHSDVAYDWLRDPTEIVRVKEVAARRAEGRGPPKKGQGKRSQMKRK
ncbi:mitochondral 37S ribosomal protein S27 [Naganishia albida]|nr:mitochondral 37S ribosomal protein S27 [Naganishia albida]